MTPRRAGVRASLRARGLVLAVVAATSAACGSTFPVESGAGTPVVAGGVPAQDQGGLAGGDSGLSIASPTDDPGAGTGTGSSTTFGGGATTAGTAAATSGSGSSDTPSSSTSGAGTDTRPSSTGTTPTSDAPDGPRPVAPGQPGIDDEKVVVGLTYTEDSSAANSALGAGGITTGDQRRNFEAVLGYFNARGGAGGREIVPVYHKYEATSSQPYAVQEQAACATFTQDHPVFVSLAGGLPAISDGTFNACMHAAGTPILAGSAQSDQNDDSFRRWPHFVQASTLSLDAIARLWPAGLDESGYFEPRTPAGETRLGLLTYDNNTLRTTTERSLKPALATLGHEFVEEAYVRQPSSFSDVSDMSAEVQSAVLRFRSQGIEHVMIQDLGNAILTLLFLNSAESQSYRPRYGLTTNNGGQLLVGTVPEAQYAEARMVGWLPDVDVPPSGFDEPMGRGRALCESIYDEAGITYSGNSALVAYGQCDQIRTLVAAFEAGSGPLAQDTLVGDFVSVGNSFETALAGPTRYAADRHYGIARYRLAEFSGGCSCFTYTGPWRAAG